MQTKLLTIPAFARATGLTYSLARELVRRGDIPSVQVGPRRRISSEWIEKWIRPSAEKPQAAHAAVLALDAAADRDPECRSVYRAAADQLAATLEA